MSPGLSDSLIQVENTPPGTLRMPTRSSPSAAPAQIEYERRSLAAGDRVAQRQVLALGEAELLGELGGHVERDDDGLVGLGADALDAQRMEVEAAMAA